MDPDDDWHETDDGDLGDLGDVEEDAPELLKIAEEVEDLTGGDPSGDDDPAAGPDDLNSLDDDEYFRLQGIETLAHHAADYEHEGLLVGKTIYNRRRELTAKQVERKADPDVVAAARAFDQKTRRERDEKLAALAKKEGREIVMATDE